MLASCGRMLVLEQIATCHHIVMHFNGSVCRRQHHIRRANVEAHVRLQIVADALELLIKLLLVLTEVGRDDIAEREVGGHAQTNEVAAQLFVVVDVKWQVVVNTTSRCIATFLRFRHVHVNHYVFLFCCGFVLCFIQVNE